MKQTNPVGEQKLIDREMKCIASNATSSQSSNASKSDVYLYILTVKSNARILGPQSIGVLLINREHNFLISIRISLRRRLDNDNNRCDYSSAKLTGISRNGTVQGVRNQNGESVVIYYCWYLGYTL